MPPHQVRHVKKILTAEERVRHRAIREQIEQEKPALIAYGRQAKARHAMLREVIAALKRTREALGVSLADIEASIGIETRHLSCLENDPLANPTFDTLCRYAAVVGKKVVITVVDTAHAND